MSTIKDLVILVGGRGNRLKDLTKNTPKPMMKINGQPFINILLKNLSKYYFEKIYLIAGYKSKKFIKKYHNKKILFSKIIVISEKKPLGTGGALSLLRNKIKSNFILMNGDSLFDINLNIFIKKSLKYLKGNIIGSIALVQNKNYKSNNTLNNLKLSHNQIIKNSRNNQALMNGGIYLFKKKILNNFKENKISLENDFLKKQILMQNLIGFKFKNPFIDIGIKKNLYHFCSLNKKTSNNQKCIFLDRDGVINKLNGYITKHENFLISNGVEKAISFLNKQNILVIIITNQSAIARGYISENQLEKIHKFFCNKIKLSNGSFINDIYYCAFLKDAKIKKYKKDSYLRKPKPGMILNALKDWQLKKRNCYMIGDQITDKMAAQRAGVRFYFKNKNSLFTQVKKIYKIKT